MTSAADRRYALVRVDAGDYLLRSNDGRTLDRTEPRRKEVMTATIYEFQPVGYDVWDRRPNQPEPGTHVVKTKLPGCPPNGTMGHCFVKDADTNAFYGLVLQASLKRARR